MRVALFLMHGEYGSQSAMCDHAASPIPDTQIGFPEIGERWELPVVALARRLGTGRMDVVCAFGQDWQDQYPCFFTKLKNDVKRIENQAAPQQAIAAMSQVLDDYAVHRAERGTRSK